MGDHRTLEDDVEAFLAGDERTHDRMRRAVRAVVACFRLGSAAEDLIQEALYRTFLSLVSGSFRGESTLKTFAQRVAEYTCLEHLRRRQSRREVEAGAPEACAEAGPETVLLRAEGHRRDLLRLAAMSQDCRELFRMIFVENLSYMEVAKRCGTSETAIKLRVHRCRLASRDKVGSEGCGEARRWRTVGVRRGASIAEDR